MRVDLHAHTYFSDGTLSPEDLAARARARGLDVISVCDHNLLTAYPRLRPACASEGVGLVQGVEIDVYWQGDRLHLLGYGFDPTDAALARLLQHSRRELDALGPDLIRNMAADYPVLSLAEFDAYTYPRERGGWPTINYLYDKGLSTDLLDAMRYYAAYSHYRPDYPDIADACRAVREAGGVTVLAHPGSWWKDERDAVAEQFGALQAVGVQGIECYYPEHDEDFTCLCVEYCRAHGLYITCGGDCHGEFARYASGVDHDLGVLDVTTEDLRHWPGWFGA